MPQYVFVPSSSNDRNELGNRAFEHLFDNLSENIAYRQKMQAKKAATAEKLREMQATGLLPNANITVTDEGVEFDSKDAKNAFYSALGSMIGNEDRNRTGGTRSVVEVDRGDEQFNARVANAVSQDDRNTEQAMTNTMLELASQAKTLRADGANPITDPPQRQQLMGETQQLVRTNFADLASQNADMLAATQNAAIQAQRASFDLAAAYRQSLGGTKPTEVVTSLNPANPPAEVKPAEVKPAETKPAETKPAETKPAETKPDQTTPQNSTIKATGKATVKNDIDVSNRASERDQINVEYSGRDVDISNPVIATTTTERVSERIDDVRTSLKNLLGLSGYASSLDELAVAAGNTPSTNNVFATMAQRRLADIDRWEKEATQDGVTQEAKQIGTNQYKVTGAKIKASTTASGALGTHIAVSPQVTVGGTSVHNTPGNNNTPGNKVWNVSRGTYRGQDITLNNNEVLVAEATNLQIKPSLQLWRDKNGKPTPQLLAEHNKKLKNNGIEIKEENGQINFYGTNGQLLAAAVYDNHLLAIGDSGAPIKVDGQPKYGDWNLTIYPGITSSQIAKITGDNIQSGGSGGN